MPKGYYYIYKYLILYIVLSFIDNKNLINCQKIRNKIKLYEMPKEISYENGTRINVTDSSSTYCNYTALAQKSDLDEDKPQHGVTCYTCVNVSDNHVCNKYAIDKPCKLGNDFCHTLHIMDPKGKSILVNKKCANETECTPHSIGCYYIDNQKICISCCDEDYCNKKVPTQTSNATFKNARTLRQKLHESHKGRPSAGQPSGAAPSNSARDQRSQFITNFVNSVACYLFYLIRTFQ